MQKLIVLALIGLGCALPAAAVDVQALMQSADRARGGGLPGIVWTIDVETRDADGVQQRTLRVSADGRSNDSVAEFTAPGNVNGQKLVMRGRNFWFTRPGLSRPVPISPRQRLLGEVANGDIAATNYTGDYQARWLRQDTWNGRPCEVLELTAANPGVTYDRIIYWIDRDSGLALRAEFHTVSGKLIKTATFDYGQTLTWQGRSQPFISLMRIQDALRPDESSELRYRDVTVRALDPSVFRLN